MNIWSLLTVATCTVAFVAVLIIMLVLSTNTTKVDPTYYYNNNSVECEPDFKSVGEEIYINCERK